MVINREMGKSVASVFFFVMLPLRAYAIFEDKVVDFYDLDKKESEDYFNGMMQNVWRILFNNVGNQSSAEKIK
ncbi:MAG: hypothetical protein SVV67_08855 [Bacillota bacterium]|nr:hypothetical protein [Bacillota bacterium]